MAISLPIIISIAVLLVLALATPLFSPFFRKVYEEEDLKDDELPPVSIILTEHDSATHLQTVLPQLLSQHYSNDFQVIVVIDESDSDSEDVLKRYSDDPHLYYTILPDTSRYLSRKKLGLTLAMRAARHDWVLITDVHSLPSGDNWLSAIASHCGEGRNMVLGLSLYGDDCPASMRYEQLRSMLYFMRLAQHAGTAFSTNQSVVMMKKSEFFQQNGFRGNLEYTRAEFEFLVNKFAIKGKCALAIEPDARMNAIKPNMKRWHMRQLYAIDALKGMRGVWRYKAMKYLDFDAMRLYNYLTLAAVIVGALLLPTLNGTLLLSAAAALWLLSLAIRYAIYSPVLSYYDSIGALTAIILDWTMPLRDIIMRLHYRFSDKHDYITHKL